MLKAANTTFTLLSVTHYDSYGVTFTTTGVPSQIEHFTLTDGAGSINLWQQNMFAVRAEIEVGFRVRDLDHFVRITDGAVDTP